MSLVTKNTQQNITANGHVVGRDFHEHHHHHSDPSSKILADLFANYGNEAKLNQEHNDIIDELSRYINPIEVEGALRDLKTKMEESGRKDTFLRDGLWLKDDFRRKIEKYRHSPTAQKIFAYLLAAIRSHFRSNIFHHIEDMSDSDLDVAILNDVIKPVLATIPSSEPLITEDTLLGMMYFLTGNCFLEWST